MKPPLKKEFYGYTVKDNEVGRMLAGDEFGRELFFFRVCNQLGDKYTGPGRWWHGKRVVQMAWPKLVEWEINGQPNQEMDELWRALCGPETEVMVTGHKSGGKSTLAAVFALVWWMASPTTSGVLVGSTTIGGLKRRIWSEVRKFFFALPEATRIAYGWQLVEHPTPSVQTTKGDMRHGVHGVPIGGASETSALDLMRGFHPLRPCIIFDECTSISKAILKETANVMKGDAKLIGLGNAEDIFDMHGQLMEPEDGWNSVTVDTGSWKTKRGGLALHLDGEKADCVVRGIWDHPYLFSASDVDRVIKAEGHDSPAYWREVRGFWCPEGVVKSVLSATLINTHKARDRAEWGKKHPVRIGMLDPAFEGGDRCVLRFAKCGEEAGGNSVIDFTEITVIKLDVKAAEAIHYQIARKVKAECTIRGIPPAYFAMDSTGEGGGVASILKEEWGVGFLEVEFGRRADNDVSAGINDARPASDVYKNQVTQIWYAFREAVQFSQVRGLDPETCVEFCHRLYTATGTPNRIAMESKTEMKARGLRSPDFADAAVVGLHLARKRGFLGAILSKAATRQADEWRLLQEANREAEDLAYQSDGMSVLM